MVRRRRGAGHAPGGAPLSKTTFDRLVCLAIVALFASASLPVVAGLDGPDSVPSGSDPSHENWDLVRAMDDADDNRVEDGLDAKAVTTPDATVYLHLLYDRRPTPEDASLLEASYGALQTYVFHNVDRVKAEATAGAAVGFLEAPGVVGVMEFVPPVLTNAVGSRAIRAAADSGTVDDGLDHGLAAHNLTDGDGKNITGQGMVVAVLDTGIDQRHPYLNDMDGYDGTDDPKQVLGVTVDTGFAIVCVDPLDDHRHGTHVAGTAVGTGGEAGEQIQFPHDGSGPRLVRDVRDPGLNVGAAPGAKYIDIDIGMSVVATALGLGEDIAFDWVMDYNRGEAACASGVDHVENRIDVATMSFGSSSSPNSARNTLITDMVRSGVTFTVSAGNSGDNERTLGAAAEGAIIVAASDDNETVGRADDVLADFSSRGPRASDGDADTLDELRPDIAAPGVDIASANTFAMKTGGSDAFNSSGTSMATPFVAGVAALILQADPLLVPVDKGSNTAMGDVGAVPVRDVLQRTATYKTSTDGDAPQVTQTGKFGLPWNNGWGYGLVDAYTAVQMALGVVEGNFNESTIAIASPADGSTVKTGTVAVAGTVERVGDAPDLERPPGATLWLVGDGSTTTGTNPFGDTTFALSSAGLGGDQSFFDTVGAWNVQFDENPFLPTFAGHEKVTLSGDPVRLVTYVDDGEAFRKIAPACSKEAQLFDADGTPIGDASRALPPPGVGLGFGGFAEVVFHFEPPAGSYDALKVQFGSPFLNCPGPTTWSWGADHVPARLELAPDDFVGEEAPEPAATGHVDVYVNDEATPRASVNVTVGDDATVDWTVDVDLAAGNHVLTAVWVDRDGTVADDATVSVEAVPNQAPTAHIDGPSRATAGTQVTFDGSRSSDPDGTIVEWRWDMGDGTVLFGETVTHRYSEPGRMDVVLMVTDDDGATASATVRHVVEGPPA